MVWQSCVTLKVSAIFLDLVNFDGTIFKKHCKEIILALQWHILEREFWKVHSKRHNCIANRHWDADTATGGSLRQSSGSEPRLDWIRLQIQNQKWTTMAQFWQRRLPSKRKLQIVQLIFKFLADRYVSYTTMNNKNEKGIPESLCPELDPQQWKREAEMKAALHWDGEL